MKNEAIKRTLNILKNITGVDPERVYGGLEILYDTAYSDGENSKRVVYGPGVRHDEELRRELNRTRD